MTDRQTYKTMYILDAHMHDLLDFSYYESKLKLLKLQLEVVRIDFTPLPPTSEASRDL